MKSVEYCKQKLWILRGFLIWLREIGNNCVSMSKLNARFEVYIYKCLHRYLRFLRFKNIEPLQASILVLTSVHQENFFVNYWVNEFLIKLPGTKKTKPQQQQKKLLQLEFTSRIISRHKNRRKYPLC